MAGRSSKLSHDLSIQRCLRNLDGSINLSDRDFRFSMNPTTIADMKLNEVMRSSPTAEYGPLCLCRSALLEKLEKLHRGQDGFHMGPTGIGVKGNTQKIMIATQADGPAGFLAGLVFLRC